MKDDRIYLRYILRAISEIEEFTQGGANDHKTLMAVRKEIEIIGEAANHVSKTMMDNHPELPWREMIATRHKLAHEYFGINAAVLWNVVEQVLPEVKRQINNILQNDV